MSDVAVQDPQKSGDDPVQDTANPQNGADDSQNANPQGSSGDDSQSGQDAAGELPKLHYQFSKDYQGHEYLKDFKKPDDLAKAYIELKEKGGDSAEDVGNPEEYDYSVVELPEEVGEDQAKELHADMKELAKNSSLTQKQAQEVYKHLVNDYKNILEKQKQQQQENEKTLRQEYGDNVKEKLTEAHRAYERLGSKEFGDLLDSRGLGSHPTVVKAFLNLHEKVGEDTLVEGKPAGDSRDIEKEWFPNSSKSWNS